MTREQMIAWLTLEGWKVIRNQDPKFVHAVNTEQRRFIYPASGVSHKYHDGAHAYMLQAEAMDWGVWRDALIKKLVEIASNDHA